jgi:hypothetical protein
MTEKEDDTFFYYNETQHDKPKLEKYVTWSNQLVVIRFIVNNLLQLSSFRSLS